LSKVKYVTKFILHELFQESEDGDENQLLFPGMSEENSDQF